MKEIYEKYKGMKADYFGSEGVVCGYDADDLIMAVTGGDLGWFNAGEGDIIDTHKNNEFGYYYITEEEICHE